ncbi:MAG: hypothetical protein ACLPYS_14070 [Vulcanimicrobiaceae bacterium]
MIAPGDILVDDLIQELARRLNLGYGNEITELILDRPQVLAQKASRALQCHIAYIGSNDFGEEIYRVNAEAETPTHAGREIDRESPCTDSKAGWVAYRSPFNPFGALCRALHLTE